MFGTPKIKECPKDKTEMVYNNHYHMFECDKCGTTYNYGLQELRPLEDWREEYDNEDY